MTKATFNKAILFTILEYLEKATLAENAYERDKLLRLKSCISGYRAFHKFSREEALYLTELGKRKEMIRLRENEVDWAIYALELMYMYITTIHKKDRPHINFSDAKIKLLKAHLITDMLRLKQNNIESYDRVKEIINDSRITAKMYIGLLYKEVK